MPDKPFTAIFKNTETGEERTVEVQAVDIIEAALQFDGMELDKEECIEIKKAKK